MNLQSSSNVSLITGSTGVESSQNLSGVVTGVTVDGQIVSPDGAGEVFTNALLQQLELLKQTAATTSVQTAATATATATANGQSANLPVNTVQTNIVQINTPAVNPALVSSVTSNLNPALLTQQALAGQMSLNPQAATTSPILNSSVILQVQPIVSADTPTVQPQIIASLEKLKDQLTQVDINNQTQNNVLLQTTTLQDITQQAQNVLQQVKEMLQQQATQNATLSTQQIAQTVHLAQDVAEQISNMLAVQTGEIPTASQAKLPVELQEMTMLSGKQLPTTKKAVSDTDQPATVQALTDVLTQVSTAITQLAGQAQQSPGPKVLAPKIDEKTGDLSVLNTDTAAQLLVNPLPTPISAVQVVVEDTGATANNNKVAQSVIEGGGIAAKVVAPGENTSTQVLTSQSSSVPVLPGTNAKDFTGQLLSGDLPAKQDLTGLSTATASTIDVQAKDMSGRATADMLQLGQHIATDNKVSVPAMTKHVYSSEWNQELGSKIAWMTGQNISAADIKLNPEHLGPISIRIDMHQDQANISFTATNSGVKELLEASIPKLREMLGSQQLNLSDVNVSQSSFSGQGQAQAQNFGQGSEGNKHAQQMQDGLNDLAGQSDALDEVATQIEQSRAIVTNGIVSYYA